MKVFMKHGYKESSLVNDTPTQVVYYFNIGNLATFERQLEDAQYELGQDLFGQIPVTYDNSTSLMYVRLY